MIPEECVYFAWFRSTTYYSELMIVKGESLPTNYVDFNTVNIRDLRLDTMYSELYKMYRKSLYVGGDSIAFGAGSSGVSYGEIIANKYSMTITKNAVSGTTLITQTGKTNSILEKLQATTGTFDYMLLEGGINDMFISAPIGTITNSFIGGIFDTTTVIGAMEKLCETWVTKFPTAKKLFILVHRKTAYYGAGVNGIKQVDYWNAIKSVLNKWSIKYVDLSEVSNLCAYGNTYWQAYFQETSGTHPTLLAYQTFYVPILEREMFML
jgi:hypothetical protein